MNMNEFNMVQDLVKEADRLGSWLYWLRHPDLFLYKLDVSISNTELPDYLDDAVRTALINAMHLRILDIKDKLKNFGVEYTYVYTEVKKED